jgi:hypothetical protein
MQSCVAAIDVAQYALDSYVPVAAKRAETCGPRMAILHRTAQLLILTAALTAAALPATAEEYPSRTVKIIVPFGAGGPTDVYTRAIAEELRKALQQTFVMENRPGAGTTIGTDAVAKRRPHRC